MNQQQTNELLAKKCGWVLKRFPKGYWWVIENKDGQFGNEIDCPDYFDESFENSAIRCAELKALIPNLPRMDDLAIYYGEGDGWNVRVEARSMFDSVSQHFADTELTALREAAIQLMGDEA